MSERGRRRREREKREKREEREVRWRGREGKGWRRGREEEEKKGEMLKKHLASFPGPKRTWE